MVSQDSTKVTGVVGIPFQISVVYACQQKLILSMCQSAKSTKISGSCIFIYF